MWLKGRMYDNNLEFILCIMYIGCFFKNNIVNIFGCVGFILIFMILEVNEYESNLNYVVYIGDFYIRVLFFKL